MAIAPNSDYYFLPDDEKDWYRFTLEESAQVQIRIREWTATGQVVVYRGVCNPLTFIQNNGDNGIVPNRTLNLGAQPAGTYFIWVLSDGQRSVTKPYVLHVEID
jgi:hypothetical protein